MLAFEHVPRPVFVSTNEYEIWPPGEVDVAAGLLVKASTQRGAAAGTADGTGDSVSNGAF